MKRSITDLDIHIGQRLSQRRTDLGITQKALAAELGVSFQQVQKYEKGRNRMSASTLFIAAYQLSVPMEYFVESVAEIGLSAERP